MPELNGAKEQHQTLEKSTVYTVVYNLESSASFVPLKRFVSGFL